MTVNGWIVIIILMAVVVVCTVVYQLGKGIHLGVRAYQASVLSQPETNDHASNYR